MSSEGSCDPVSSEVRSHRPTAPSSCTMRRAGLAINIHDTMSFCMATDAVVNDLVLVSKQLSNSS